MNKIIWKDIDSTSIKGLLISELPAITKPKMRVQETEIDGVDGSIIEELGYESYNKQIIIGLSKDFDIDEVIEYFSGEGNVVFSNEPDKYYKARIIDQIDYERLLRFRTASVKFRVQPFKYEYNEECASLNQDVLGTEVEINDGKILSISVEGKSTQEGIPTPEAPIEIKSVGDEGRIEIETTNETYTIELDEPLRSLPNGTKDILKIENNKVYVHRFIGSIVLDGSDDELWSTYALFESGGGNGYCYVIEDSSFALGLNTSMCSCFKSEISAYSPTIGYVGAYSDHLTVHRKYFVSDIETLNEFKTWLSTNNVEVIYELEYPEVTMTEDRTGKYTMPEGNTVIVNSANADMIVTYMDDKIVANNNGNCNAKPIITIKGTGYIEFIVNDNKIFSYTFPDYENEVVIDSQKLDAYLGDVLKNRNMSGEFPIFEKGENIITWEGTIENIEITQKSRWI